MSKKYKVNTAMNFSIGADEFYLTPGTEVNLPDHELITSMTKRGHLTVIASAKAADPVKTESKKSNNEKIK
jgi:hypothetical protein